MSDLPSNPFNKLSDSEVFCCKNPEYPEVWFYDATDDGEIERYHSAFDFVCDTTPTKEEAISSITSDNVDVEVVDVSLENI